MAEVTENYLEKYKALIDEFLDEVAAGRAKARVMFTQNHFIPTGLSPDQRRAEYPMACNLKGAWYKECGYVMIQDRLRRLPFRGKLAE